MNYKTLPAEKYVEPKIKKEKLEVVFWCLSMVLVIVVAIFSIYLVLEYRNFKDPKPPLEVGNYENYSVMLGSKEEMTRLYGRTGYNLVLGNYYDKEGNFIPEDFLKIFDYDIYMVPVKDKVVGKNIFGKETKINTYEIYLIDGANTKNVIKKINEYLHSDNKPEGSRKFNYFLSSIFAYNHRIKEDITTFNIKKRAYTLIYFLKQFDIHEYIDLD